MRSAAVIRTALPQLFRIGTLAASAPMKANMAPHYRIKNV